MLRPHWIAIALMLVAFLAHGRILSHDFVSYDDDTYVTGNARVLAGVTPEGVRWALTSTAASNWHPLTWVSHMLDVSLFGLRASGHHATSLALHLANTGLLFALLIAGTGATARSAFVAGLFALHPLHVESVAWIAERKDVLSTLFWFLSILAWFRFARMRSRAAYIAALGFFTLGLASKPMLVTAPFALILLDVWPLGRSGLCGPARSDHPIEKQTPIWLVAEKIPFFLLTIASILITLKAQELSIATTEALPVAQRIANSIVAYPSYLLLTIWPHDLSALNLHPSHWPAPTIAIGASVLAAISLLAVVSARRYPFLIIGWLWFLGTLVPVIGIVQVGEQWIADRYSYVPLTGIFICVSWGAAEFWKQRAWPKSWAIVLAALVLAACSGASFEQARHWRDSKALFSRMVEIDPGNSIGHNGLGLALERIGAGDDALRHYQLATRGAPYADGEYNLGRFLMDRGKTGRAIPHLERASDLDPDRAETHFYLALASVREGRDPDAVRHYEAGLLRKPDELGAREQFVLILLRLAEASTRRGEFEAAVSLAERAVGASGNPALDDLKTEAETRVALYRKALREIGTVQTERLSRPKAED